jgi:hypothetical protein
MGGKTAVQGEADGVVCWQHIRFLSKNTGRVSGFLLNWK